MSAEFLDLVMYDVINAVVRLQLGDGLWGDRGQRQPLGASLEVSLQGDLLTQLTAVVVDADVAGERLSEENVPVSVEFW